MVSLSVAAHGVVENIGTESGSHRPCVGVGRRGVCRHCEAAEQFRGHDLSRDGLCGLVGSVGVGVGRRHPQVGARIGGPSACSWLPRRR